MNTGHHCYWREQREGSIATAEAQCPYPSDEIGKRCAWLAGFRDRKWHAPRKYTLNAPIYCRACGRRLGLCQCKTEPDQEPAQCDASILQAQ